MRLYPYIAKEVATLITPSENVSARETQDRQSLRPDVCYFATLSRLFQIQ